MTNMTENAVTTRESTDTKDSEYEINRWRLSQTAPAIREYRQWLPTCTDSEHCDYNGHDYK